MNKLIAIVAALATTSSLYVTSAEAGCGGGGHGFYRASYRSVARVSKPRIAHKNSTTSVAAVATPDVKAETKQVAEAQVIEKKDETVAVDTAPVTEKAKVAEAKPADAKAAVEVASVAKDCKQFFPSAGLTLSVPCE